MTKVINGLPTELQADGLAMLVMALNLHEVLRLMSKEISKGIMRYRFAKVMPDGRIAMLDKTYDSEESAMLDIGANRDPETGKWVGGVRRMVGSPQEDCEDDDNGL